MAEEQEGAVNPQTAFTEAAAGQEIEAIAPIDAPVEAPAPDPSPVEQIPSQSGDSSPPIPPSEESPDTGLFELARSAGFDVSNYNSPEELVGGLLKSHSQAALQLQQLQQPQSPEPPAQEPAPPTAEQVEDWNAAKYLSGKWDLPEWDPAWDQMMQMGLIEKTANGYAPTRGNEYLKANPQLLALNQFDNGRAERLNDLLYGGDEGNLLGNIWSAFQEPLERMLNERMNSVLSERTEAEELKTVVSAFDQDNSSWIYDQSGQPTEKGKEFFSMVEKIQSGDAGAVLQAAKAMFAPQAEEAIQDPGTPVTETQPAAPAPAPSKQESFLQESYQAAAHQPSSLSSSVTATPEGEMSDEEIMSMFVNDYRRSVGAA